MVQSAKGKQPFQQFVLPDYSRVNSALLRAFAREAEGNNARHSHYESGRYENIYIQRAAIPEVEPVYQHALELARRILCINDLKSGFWFNAMLPGQKTVRHNHSESDELLSAVYYVDTPPGCGDLLMHTADKVWRITPRAGSFVFFAPQLAHQVEENKSLQQRLSVAFNFAALGG